VELELAAHFGAEMLGVDVAGDAVGVGDDHPVQAGGDQALAGGDLLDHFLRRL
jgi:hypothetical protein